MQEDGASLVETRELEGEHKAVWSHAFSFLWEVEFKISIRSQREGHGKGGGRAESSYWRVLWELERLLKVEVSECQCKLEKS